MQPLFFVFLSRSGNQEDNQRIFADVEADMCPLRVSNIFRDLENLAVGSKMLAGTSWLRSSHPGPRGRKRMAGEVLHALMLLEKWFVFLCRGRAKHEGTNYVTFGLRVNPHSFKLIYGTSRPVWSFLQIRCYHHVCLVSPSTSGAGLDLRTNLFCGRKIEQTCHINIHFSCPGGIGQKWCKNYLFFSPQFCWITWWFTKFARVLRGIWYKGAVTCYDQASPWAYDIFGPPALEERFAACCCRSRPWGKEHPEGFALTVRQTTQNYARRLSCYKDWKDRIGNIGSHDIILDLVGRSLRYHWIQLKLAVPMKQMLSHVGRPC